MLDLHCHILPGVDDGAVDMDEAVAMARSLVSAGFSAVAASPHVGEGPGGDAPLNSVSEALESLSQRLKQEDLGLELLPNGEHYLTVELLERIDSGEVIPVGGKGRWLMVELPWTGLTDPEGALFRIQAKGYRILLAHPERYESLGLDVLGRLVGRGVKTQLGLASVLGFFGEQERVRAKAMLTQKMTHVVATDLHRSRDSETWIGAALKIVESTCGATGLGLLTQINPRLIVGDATPDEVLPVEKAT